MISVCVEKGYEIRIAGKPSTELVVLKTPGRLALCPERIPYVKPRLKVKSGDRVRIGSPLFEDKRNTDVLFLSPGCGEIEKIDFGPRRVIRQIVIKLDADESHESFPVFTEKEIESIDRKQVIRAITSGGIWPFIRSLPFRDIADPEETPPAIIVALDTKDPFHPISELYLKDRIELFKFGLTVLHKLAGVVWVSAASDNGASFDRLNGYMTHQTVGKYPAEDPGVLLYHIKKGPEENRAWYINGQDVLLLAGLLQTGKFPVERVMAVGGPPAPEKKHVLTRIGAPLADILGEGAVADPSFRYIVGGLFRGYVETPESYMGFYETALTVLEKGDQKEFLGFARPGYHKPSRSRAFLSVFNKSEFPYDSGRHGETRACINCGYCAGVCPVDILPQFTFKSILADEIEEALAHGLLDCVECGLCSYVCPSKIELTDRLKQTKKLYYLEKV